MKNFFFSISVSDKQYELHFSNLQSPSQITKQYENSIAQCFPIQNLCLTKKI